jgi:UDP-glucose 4-epimerase
VALILKQVKCLTTIQSSIILTGSCGYVGTATKELLEKSGCTVFGVDKKIKRDTRFIIKYLINLDAKCIIHLSAKKSIPESKKKPLSYYLNNILSTFMVGVASRLFNIPVIFASSAAIYNPSNPYAKSKKIEENILRLLCHKLVILRYFNIVGKTRTASDEGSTNIFSVINENSSIKISSTISTRDYVHILDIAMANVLAINYLENNKYLITDIFTGQRKSVLDIIEEYKKNNYSIKYTVAGFKDSSVLPSIDNRGILGWEPRHTFEQAIKSEIEQ